MTIEQKHQRHAERAAQWRKVRDCVAGEDRVKLRRYDYLPKLPKQDLDEDNNPTDNTDQYDAYLLRSEFYNVVRRTVDGMVGLVMRKPADAELHSLEEWAQHRVSREGDTLDAFVHDLLTEAVTTDFGGILVDFPAASDDVPMTVAAAEAQNIAPFWTLYRAERLYSWRQALVANELKLVRLVLEEDYEDFEHGIETPPAVAGRGVGHNYFGTFGATTVKQQLRELYIDEQGIYQQQVWRKQDNSMDFVRWGPPVTPRKGTGEPLREIPFVMMPKPSIGEVPVPPMLDIANLNLRHYRLGADLSHGLHFTALPTYYIFGVDEASLPDAVGAQRVWHSDAAETHAGILEFTGAGLGAIADERERVEKRMAALGARMLRPIEAAFETATGVNVRTVGETSALSNMAHAVSGVVRRALHITEQWNSGVEQSPITYSLNTDFMPVRMPSDMLLALLQAWQQGAISFETLYNNLKKGEVVSTDRDIEDEKVEIEDEGRNTTAEPSANPFEGLDNEDDDEDA